MAPTMKEIQEIKKVGLDDNFSPSHMSDISIQLQALESSPVSVQSHEAVTIEESPERGGDRPGSYSQCSGLLPGWEASVQPKSRSLPRGSLLFTQLGSALVSVFPLEVGQRNPEPRSCQGWSQAPGGWEPKVHTHVNTEQL